MYTNPLLTYSGFGVGIVDCVVMDSEPEKNEQIYSEDA